jgi:hypothetical protein
MEVTAVSPDFRQSLSIIFAVVLLCSGLAARQFANGDKNVMEFGCKGDGKTDDRLCIEDAANSLSLSGGGVLVLPAKHTFLIASASKPGYLITWPANVGISGTGTIKVADNAGEYRALISVRSARNISFQNVTFDGNASHNEVNSDPINTNEHITLFLTNGENVTVKNIKFINGNDVQTLSLNGCDFCHVTGNSWSNFGIGGAVDHDSSEVYLVGNGGTVEGNTFQAAGIGVRTAIEVHHGNTRVSGNVITGYRTGILASPEQTTAGGAVIEGNEIGPVYYGISIWATDGDWEGITISKNKITIKRDSYWKVSNDESGIALYPLNSHAVRNLTIAANEIRFVPDALPLNSYSGGISLIAPNKSASITDVLVTNNLVERSLGAGINWSVAGMSKNVVIEKNKVLNSGSTTNRDYPAVFRTGILDISNASLTGCFIRNNVVADDLPTPTTRYGIYHYGVAGDNAESGLRIEGNTVSYRGNPTSAQQYFIARKTIPSFRVAIPNFEKNSTVLVDILKRTVPDNVVVEDPTNGRIYPALSLRLGDK